MSSYGNKFRPQLPETQEELQTYRDFFGQTRASQSKRDFPFTYAEDNSKEDISPSCSSLLSQIFDFTPLSQTPGEFNPFSNFLVKSSKSTVLSNEDDQVTENCAASSVKGPLQSLQDAFSHAPGRLFPYWKTSFPYMDRKHSDSSIGQRENAVRTVQDKGGMDFNSSSVLQGTNINFQVDTNSPFTLSSASDLNNVRANFPYMNRKRFASSIDERENTVMTVQDKGGMDFNSSSALQGKNINCEGNTNLPFTLPTASDLNNVPANFPCMNRKRFASSIHQRNASSYEFLWSDRSLSEQKRRQKRSKFNGNQLNTVMTVHDKGGMDFNSSSVLQGTNINFQVDINLPFTLSSASDLNNVPANFDQNLIETSSHSSEYKSMTIDSSKKNELPPSSKFYSSNLKDTVSNVYQDLESEDKVADYSACDLQNNTDLPNQSLTTDSTNLNDAANNVYQDLKSEDEVADNSACDLQDNTDLPNQPPTTDSTNLKDTVSNVCQDLESEDKVADYSACDLQDNTDLHNQSPTTDSEKKHENKTKNGNVIMTRSRSARDKCAILILPSNSQDTFHAPLSDPFSCNKSLDSLQIIRSKETEKCVTCGSDDVRRFHSCAIKAEKSIINEYESKCIPPFEKQCYKCLIKGDVELSDPSLSKEIRVFKRETLNSSKLRQCISGSGKKTQCYVKLNRIEEKRNGELHDHYYDSHQKKKIFFCNICNKRFKRLASLKVHRKIHTGEKQFHCKMCRKRFYQKGNLMSHLQRHKNKGASDVEKKFLCSSCNKRFQHQAHLKMHHMIHTGEKPFQCKSCGKCFSQKGNLKTHLRKTHLQKTHLQRHEYKENSKKYSDVKKKL